MTKERKAHTAGEKIVPSIMVKVFVTLNRKYGNNETHFLPVSTVG